MGCRHEWVSEHACAPRMETTQSCPWGLLSRTGPASVYSLLTPPSLPSPLSSFPLSHPPSPPPLHMRPGTSKPPDLSQGKGEQINGLMTFKNITCCLWENWGKLRLFIKVIRAGPLNAKFKANRFPGTQAHSSLGKLPRRIGCRPCSSRETLLGPWSKALVGIFCEKPACCFPNTRQNNWVISEQREGQLQMVP